MDVQREKKTIANLSAALLYDWLRLQAAQPPQVRVKCFGSHKEHRHQHGSDKKDEVTVVDFDFYVCHLFFPEPELAKSLATRSGMLIMYP